jgi:hypothetical protein
MFIKSTTSVNLKKKFNKIYATVGIFPYNFDEGYADSNIIILNSF